MIVIVSNFLIFILPIELKIEYIWKNQKSFSIFATHVYCIELIEFNSM